jgi:hypothetical protein
MKSIDSDSKGVAEDFLEGGPYCRLHWPSSHPKAARIQRVKV